ncbi:MAG: hypothetical protein JRN52_10485 [Nitrososphaerota archaeon]|nr:hypothetical protein [Nitrososphaerota archaeon]
MQTEEENEVFSKSNRVITERNSKNGRGLGKMCYLCGETIVSVPYFSHLSGGSHRIHYYHLKCAEKVNFL